MAFRLTPPVFRREVERRMLDIQAVQALLGEKHRQTIWKKVNAGKIPEPILRMPRAYAFWDRDELVNFINGK